MNIKSAFTLTTIGLAATITLSSPAVADVWWETKDGTLYWDGAVGDYGVLRFLLKDQDYKLDKNSAFYVDGMGPLYTSNGKLTGTYGGLWFKYGRGARNSCDFEVEDPEGNKTKNWGSLSITYKQDDNYFTLELSNCEHPEVTRTLEGTPGE